MKTAEEILSDRIQISSPLVLRQIAQDLQELVSKGLLKQIKGNCDVFDIKANKPFPEDVIGIEFETVPGGSRYYLSCETYHGSGGEFRRTSASGNLP